MTQTERVVEYIKEFGSITPLEALRDLGIMRLGARIFELRAEGYPIRSEMVSVKNRFGGMTKIAKYSMEV